MNDENLEHELILSETKPYESEEEKPTPEQVEWLLKHIQAK